MSLCSVGHSVCTGGPSEATGSSWALSAGGCPTSSRAALPWKHGSAQEMWKWRIHIKVSLNLQTLRLFLCFHTGDGSGKRHYTFHSCERDISGIFAWTPGWTEMILVVKGQDPCYLTSHLKHCSLESCGWKLQLDWCVEAYNHKAFSFFISGLENI